MAYSAVKIFPFSKDKVYNAILTAVPKISGMKVSETDAKKGYILMEYHRRWTLAFDDIPLTVTEISLGQTLVSVATKSGSATVDALLWPDIALLNIEKNRRNIEKIFEETSKALE